MASTQAETERLRLQDLLNKGRPKRPRMFWPRTDCPHATTVEGRGAGAQHSGQPFQNGLGEVTVSFGDEKAGDSAQHEQPATPLITLAMNHLGAVDCILVDAS
jgi:hypothetical protein